MKRGGEGEKEKLGKRELEAAHGRTRGRRAAGPHVADRPAGEAA
jgi:hypothetical protein